MPARSAGRKCSWRVPTTTEPMSWCADCLFPRSPLPLQHLHGSSRRPTLRRMNRRRPSHGLVPDADARCPANGMYAGSAEPTGTVTRAKAGRLRTPRNPTRRPILHPRTTTPPRPRTHRHRPPRVNRRGSAASVARTCLRAEPRAGRAAPTTAVWRTRTSPRFLGRALLLRQHRRRSRLVRRRQSRQSRGFRTGDANGAESRSPAALRSVGPAAPRPKVSPTRRSRRPRRRSSPTATMRSRTSCIRSFARCVRRSYCTTCSPTASENVRGLS